jgi:hypothetical protein
MIIHRSTLDPDMGDLTDCISPIDFMPVSDEGRTIIEEYERNNPVILKIRYTPHLKLKLPQFDMNRAWTEVKAYYDNDDFMKLDLKGIPPADGGQFFWYDGVHSTWGSRALVNYIPQSKGTWGKEDREIAIRDYPQLQPTAAALTSRRPFLQDMKFYKTEVWDALPYITSYIMDYICDDFNNMRRTHLYRLKSGGRLNFHNHRLLPWESTSAPHDEGIVHIPLFTHPSSIMYEQIGDSDWIDAQHYGTGETWLLNTYMNHAVDNKHSPVDRLHLTIMVDFSDKKFSKLIENSI